jgi:hypothetical protein
MILLGVNCGFGNGDCAGMVFEGLNLESGWLDCPRPKTGIPRRCPLWPETVTALRAVIVGRPKPADYLAVGLVFLTARGNPFIHITTTKEERDGKQFIKSSNRKGLIGLPFGKLLDALGARREGVGLHALRRTFETIAGESKDQVAADLVMGHTDSGMAATYRERVSDADGPGITRSVRLVFPTRHAALTRSRPGREPRSARESFADIFGSSRSPSVVLPSNKDTAEKANILLSFDPYEQVECHLSSTLDATRLHRRHRP